MTWYAAFAARFPRLGAALHPIYADGGGIRNFVSVGGVVIGLPAGLATWAYQQRRQAEALNEIAAVQARMEGVQASIERWARLQATATTDAMFSSVASLRPTHARLAADPFFLPGSKGERDCLLEYADWVGMVAASAQLWEREALAERYGAKVERLLANPFVQDTLLGNPFRWAGVVALGRAVLAVTSAGAGAGAVAPLATEARQEAAAFLAAYDAESAACHAVVAAIARERDGRVADALRAAATEHVHVAGSAEDSLYLTCTYTRAAVRRRRGRGGGGVPVPPPSSPQTMALH